jgi:hypothetical protein
VVRRLNIARKLGVPPFVLRAAEPGKKWPGVRSRDGGKSRPVTVRLAGTRVPCGQSLRLLPSRTQNVCPQASFDPCPHPPKASYGSVRVTTADSSVIVAIRSSVGVSQ